MSRAPPWIDVTEEAVPAEVEALIDGVKAFNRPFCGDGDRRRLSALARDAGGLAGGVAGRTIYGHFLIDVVWVREDLRGSGLGRRLMQAAEAEARRRGCRASQVDTLSFQGLGFYQRLGFRVVGRVNDFPVGHARYFLLKDYA
ncbi:MAG: GNAT family N-acetyltransferase [Gammaproteobacteria bacterium]